MTFNKGGVERGITETSQTSLIYTDTDLHKSTQGAVLDHVLLLYRGLALR